MDLIEWRALSDSAKAVYNADEKILAIAYYIEHSKPDAHV